MQALLHNVAEYITPVLRESRFLSQGVLTPEEFVAAGDHLVHWCPTWEWAAGDPDKRRSHLPADKQFLQTRNVPCRRRVVAMENEYEAETELPPDEGAAEGDEGWLATHSGAGGRGVGAGAGAADERKVGDEEDEYEDADVISSGNPLMPPAAPPAVPAGAAGGGLLGGVVIDEDYASRGGPGAPARQESEGDDEYEDWDAYEEPALAEEDAAALPAAGFVRAEEPADEGDDGIVRTRSYDITISYDKYYQVPHVWLFGYGEGGDPLEPSEIMEDIMQDYANRTVTVEAHPHVGARPCASIHPCQHAATMRRIGESLQAAGKTPRADEYLLLFLKFIQSVVPTIDYDHTASVDGGGARTT